MGFFIHDGAFYDTSDLRITGPGRDGDFTNFFRGSMASSYARNDPADFAIWLCSMARRPLDGMDWATHN